MHVRTTTTELAEWLEREGGLWHVEGEAALAATLPLPAPASSLVHALRQRDAELAMLAPEASPLDRSSANMEVTAGDISSAAHVIDGQRVFQLAWIQPDGALQDSWLLAEQRGHSGRGDDGSAARKVVDAFRAAQGQLGKRSI